MQSLQTSPRVQSSKPVSKARLAKLALLARYDDGSIYALSLSEPGKTYRVELEPLSCACPGFQFRGRCYHVAAAVERFGTVQCGSCGQHVAAAEAHRNGGYTGWNHNDYTTCAAFRGNIQRQYGCR